MKKSLIFALCLSALGGNIYAQSSAAVKNYPDKQVRMVIPFPPGGATDVIGRIMAQELSKSLNQQVVPDNRGGDSGNIGADMVAKSPADGYTLLMGALTSHAINTGLNKDSIKYNLEKDFTPVGVVGVVPLVFVVNPSVPVNNMKEFIAYAKANPGKLTFASSGAGAPQRLAMEMFRAQLGLDLLHVPYKGTAQIITDMIGGQVDLYVGTLGAFEQHEKSGKVKILATATEKRLPFRPELVTVSESGVPGFAVSVWFGMVATAGTPTPVLNKIYQDVAEILKNNAFINEVLTPQALIPGGDSRADFGALMKADTVRWGEIIKTTGIKP